MLKSFVHEGFMQHAECTRATRFWRDFEHFGGKIHENFDDVTLAHRNEDGQTSYSNRAFNDQAIKTLGYLISRV